MSALYGALRESRECSMQAVEAEDRGMRIKDVMNLLKNYPQESSLEITDGTNPFLLYKFVKVGNAVEMWVTVIKQEKGPEELPSEPLKPLPKAVKL